MQAIVGNPRVPSGRMRRWLTRTGRRIARVFRSSPAHPVGANVALLPAGRQFATIPTYDRWSSHPGYGATPDIVNAIYRQAEAGALHRQCDLFDDLIEADGHLRSLIESRVAAVAGKEWTIQAGGPDDASINAARELEDILRGHVNFHELLEHQLKAPYFGFSATEVVWRFDGARAVPAWFLNAPHARFRLDDYNDLRLITGFDDVGEGAPLVEGKWIVTRMPHRNLARAGLMRTASWWALFKRMSVRDWMIFAEKFGIPNVTGRYQEGASPESKEALLRAVEDIGEGGHAILSDLTQIHISEATQRGGDVSALHPSVVALCEAQLSKLINGATQNIETGTAGSYAQARVHENRAFDLVQGDARRMAQAFHEHLGVPFIRYNGGLGGAKPPQLKIRIFPEMDAELRVRLASSIANDLGGEIDASQLYDDVGLRRPLRSEDALRGTKSAAAAPAGEEAADAA